MQIVPFLWFTNQTEAAIQFYTSIFPDSKIVSIKRYSEDLYTGFQGDMAGKILNVEFELAGQRFMALDGGDVFKFTPAISFYVSCKDEAEIDAYWQSLSAEGKVLMPLQEYPFSPKFGWLEDQYGVSWQLSIASQTQKITPFLMFVNEHHGQAESAMEFYTEIFEASGIEAIQYTEAQTVQHAMFNLDGYEMMASDSDHPHDFDFTGAISFYVGCDTQDEIDQLWEKLSAVPQAEQCGWLQDKFGISWQIVPNQFEDMMMDDDTAKVKRVFDAMLTMKKLDLAALRVAYEG